MNPAPATPLLDRVRIPADLKNFSADQLRQVAAELRAETVHAVSQTGGHLGASLGVVELTVAIHAVFDTPKDKLIWDVGHQAYPHKILTGRRDRIHTLRQPGGLSGFTRRSESEYDPFGAAHSSTSISAALGLAVARELGGEPPDGQGLGDCIAVIGDGAVLDGVVIGDGGAVKPLTLLARLGAAGPLGSGHQHWPWISLRDEAGALIHLIDHELDGPVNLAGPQPATASELIRAIAHNLHRPYLLPAPAPLLRLALGEAVAQGLDLLQRPLEARLELGEVCVDPRVGLQPQRLGLRRGGADDPGLGNQLRGLLPGPVQDRVRLGPGLGEDLIALGPGVGTLRRRRRGRHRGVRAVEQGEQLGAVDHARGRHGHGPGAADGLDDVVELLLHVHLGLATL